MKRLIGKTIQSIETIGDYDYLGNGERVSEVTKITCTDGTEVCLLADGGDGDFYCTIYGAKLNTTTNNLVNNSGRAIGSGFID